MDHTNDDGEITNFRLQEDEIEALSSIFEDDWILEDNNVYSIKISSHTHKEIYFQITLPESYPLYSPPTYQISAPWMSRSAKNMLHEEIEEIYSQNIGESIIYLWIDKIKNFIEQDNFQSKINELNAASVTDEDTQDVECVLENLSFVKEIEIDELPAVEHGEPIIDRKSVFQAHLAKVVCMKQVKQVLEKLKEKKKIATATHNIYAYRIACQKNGSFIQDCEDDGENKAGSSLLHLLQVLDVSDILVIVSRWYGGIHLGPDRFKHINNAARTLLCQSGYIKNEEKKSKSTAKSYKK